MNIFIDTCILYKDPFLNGTFFKELVSLVIEKDIKIYISNIVLKELEKNYGKIVDEKINQQRKLTEDIKTYQIATIGNLSIDKQKAVENLTLYYDKLISDDIIQILDYSNDMLPEIVERAIWRKKPFTDHKTELKDTIIWLTYSKFAESKSLNDCIFLTENVNDFCDLEKVKKGIYEIHIDLQKDCKRFKVYKSIKDLVQKEKEKLQSTSQKFGIWLSEQEFDSEFVLSILENDFNNEIQRKVERYIENFDLHQIFDEEYFLTGYVTVDYISFDEVSDINVDTFKDECIISGILSINCSLEGFEYNVVRDPGEDKFRYYGDTDVVINLSFSFYYDRDELPRLFSIDYICIV